MFADVVFLFVARKKITPTMKALLTVLLIVLVIYFVFVLWVIFASGNTHPIADPYRCNNKFPFVQISETH